MAWSYRKRIKIAPGVNINLSKNGISTSVGPKGAKINVGPKGTSFYTSIPGTGIYNRTKLSSRSDRKNSSSYKSSLYGSGSDKKDKTGCIWLIVIGCLLSIILVLSDLSKDSPSFIEDLEIIGVITFVMLIFIGILFAIYGERRKTANRKEVSRLTSEITSSIIESINSDDTIRAKNTTTCNRIDKVRMDYDSERDVIKKKIIGNYLSSLIIEDANERIAPEVEKWRSKVEKRDKPSWKQSLASCQESLERALNEASSLRYDPIVELTEYEKESYALFCQAFNTLKTSECVWKIETEEVNNQAKSRARTLVTRSIVHLSSGFYKGLDIPSQVPVFPITSFRKIYFYPRFIIVTDFPSGFDVIPLSKVSIRYSQTRFHEESGIPSDAILVGSTYKYVNKSGDPDLRFSNNPKISIALYGELLIKPLGFTYQFSRYDFAKSFELSFRALQDAYNDGINNQSSPISDTPIPKDSNTDSTLITPSEGKSGVGESYFNDILDAAKRLLEFGDLLANNPGFCKLIGESISGSVNWNGRILADPRDKMPIYLWADVIHCYSGLGHGFDLSTNEGLGLVLFNTLMAKKDVPMNYLYWDMFKENLVEASESFTKKSFASMSKVDMFMLEVCLKEYDIQLHNQYVVLLYRFASLVAKADKNISSTEATWLNKIMALKEPEGEEDHIIPIESIDNTKEKTSIRKPRSRALKELNSLIGLSSVKSEINTLTNYIKVQNMRAEKGMKVSPVSYHCVFTGNPGTGKTTVARIVSEIYKELGILKKGHLVETDRSGLVAEYVGQTAVKTNKIIDSALDGVLFIDEAYSLVDGGQSDYGKEAISTLLKRMEDDRDRLVVILAGYTDDMKRFIDSNPGLQSRFNRYIEFPDYSSDELFQIFESSTKKYEYKLTDTASEVLKEVLNKAVEGKDKSFGNGRYVRNLFERVVENQANRISIVPDITAESLATIEEEDIKKSL